MKTKWKRALSLLLTLVMVMGVLPNHAFALTAEEAGSDSSGWTGKPSTAEGKVLLSIFDPQDTSLANTFPGEPATHSGSDYQSFTDDFTAGEGDYFDAETVLNGDTVLANLEPGGTGFFGYYSVWGIYDTAVGLAETYFTESFLQQLDANKAKMITAVKGVTEAEAENYEIVWYVIKYQTIDTTWHVNGLIRELDKYSVQYSGNGATSGDVPDGAVDLTYTQARNYDVATAGNLSKSGCSFMGWNTKADGTGTFYEAGKAGDLTKAEELNLTLYAQWRQNSSCTVTWYNDDGSILHLDSVESGASVTYDGATPTKAPTVDTVYTFASWNTKADGTGDTYASGDSHTVTGNLAFYARYDSAPRTYTVTWLNHDGTPLETDSGVHYGDIVTYGGATPVKAATVDKIYSFTGWNTAADGTGDTYTDSGFAVQSDLTLYAQFDEGTQTYTITWVNEDGTELYKDEHAPYNSTPVYGGATPTKAPTVDTTYTFAGWDSEITPVTGNKTYTARFTDQTRGYTVFWYVPHLAATDFWGNGQWGVVEMDKNVLYGTTPTFDTERTFVHNGITYSMDDSDANYDYEWTGWSPAIYTVGGDVTYTATYNKIPKLFTGQVNVWLDPVITDGAVTGGTRVPIETMLDGAALYLLDNTLAAPTAQDYIPLSYQNGAYTATLPAGTYKIMVKGGGYGDYTQLVPQLLTINGGGGSADILFYSVTYDLNGGTHNGSATVTEHYLRGTAVPVASFTPALEGYDFQGWLEGTTARQAGDIITDPQAGIAQPHTLTAQWAKALRANVTVNVTIHHHTHFGTTGIQGLNPQAGKGELIINLTQRQAGTDLDYWEYVGYEATSTDWYDDGTTTSTQDPLKSTTVVTAAYTASGLPIGLEYSANAQLSGYVVFDRTVDVTTDADGNKSYTVNVEMQYWPDLFNFTYQVIADPSVPAELIPAAVDLKILSWDANAENDWAPINRHLTSSVDVKFDRNLTEGGTTYTDAPRVGNGVYPLPVYKVAYDSDVSVDATVKEPYYFRVAVDGFTLPDGSDLAAATTDLKRYDSVTNVSGGDMVTYVIPLTYADKAYFAEVTVNGGSAVDGMTVPGVYGVTPAGTIGQVGTVSIRIYINAYEIAFDANGGQLKDASGNDITRLTHQFRIPELTDYVPTRSGGYVFDGWYLADDSGAITDIPATPAAVLTENVTLIAKWKEPLTVSGRVAISTRYELGGETYAINTADRALSATVWLERTYPISGVVDTIQIVTIPSVDYETHKDLGIGVGDYAFDPVPDDGSTYRIYVAVSNYNEAFLNETNSDVSGNRDDFTLYGSDSRAVDGNGDGEAIVHAYLSLQPENFDLTWAVNSSQIGDDSLRPDSVSILVQYNDKNDGSMDTTAWPVIIQHKQGDVYYPETTELSGDSVTDSYPVWKFHPLGYPYNYSVLLHGYTTGGSTVSYSAATAPFTAIYYPDIAWWESSIGGQQSNAPTAGSDPVVYLIPKEYTITYDLNAGGDAVTGMDGAPTAHTWSFETSGIPTALTRSGYDFLGWDASASGAYADGKIGAAVAEDVTLTAQWRKQKQITFVVENGAWADGTTESLTYHVSLGQGTVDIKNLVPTGMTAAAGYENGSWGGDHALLTGSQVLVSDETAVTYTYSFARKSFTVTYMVDDPAGNDLMEASDTLPYGDYIRVNPNNGTWHHGGRVYTGTEGTDLKVEDNTTLANPTRTGYKFMGWQKTPGAELKPDGGRLTCIYTAIWWSDSNNDQIPDVYEKTVLFRIENGTWDGSDASEKSVTVTLLDSSGNWSVTGSADISAYIPDVTGAQPSTGYLAESAFWSPALPENGLVSGTNTELFVYTHYTTVTYADGERNMADTTAPILPGRFITVDPNGGAWIGSADRQTTQVNTPYTLAEPTRADYEFAGWVRTSGSGDSEYLFTAQWRLKTYTITWADEDGTVLETDTEVLHGTVPTFDGDGPAKDATAEYTYAFAGWSPAVIAASADVTYTATYRSTKNLYTVTWKNWNGNVLDTDTVEYGFTPSFVGTPSKPGDAQYSYNFTGWSPAIVPVTGDVTYTAQFEPRTNTYTIIWQDENGGILRADTVEYGQLPSYGSTPVKDATAEYTYTFSGWTPAVTAVTGDAAYTATYAQTTNSYTITWLDEDGGILRADTVEYGQLPSYGSTPAKDATAEYTYTFAGWSPAVTTVTGDAAYQAAFTATKRQYTVTWLNYNDATLEVDTTVPYGTIPTFNSEDKITVEDANSDYRFEGWYLAADTTQTLVDISTTPVTGNVTYKAKYTVTPKARTVTINVWLNNASLSDFGTVTNGLRPNLYLVPVTDPATGALAAPDQYIPVSRDAVSGAYIARLLPGDYRIYAGTTAADAILEADQLVEVLNSDVTVNTYYNCVTYLDGTSDIPFHREYFKSGSAVSVIGSVPARQGFVFTHWTDQDNAVYSASTDELPVSLSSLIVKDYTLTAQWQELVDIRVVVKIDHADKDGIINPNLTNDLQLHLTRSTTGDSYGEVYGTAVQLPYSRWYTQGDAASTAEYTYTGQPGNYFYSAHAILDGYNLDTINVSDDGRTVTIELHYDPAGFTLKFDVAMVPGVNPSLYPSAVDVKIIYWDGTAWALIPSLANESIEVPIDADGKGSGSYHVWTANDAGSLYLYRIIVDDFDLGATRGTLTAVDGSTKYVDYSSEASQYHPAGAYTASVAVAADCGCSVAETGLPAAHAGDDTTPQHGAITVTVDVAPYTVVLNYQDGRTPNTEYPHRFLLPSLGAAPTREGYTFLGWWTGDGTGGNWGTQVNAAGGAIIKELVPSGSDTLTLNLYAKWQKDLTVAGLVQVSNRYTLNEKETFIHEHDRPDTVTIQLLRINGGMSAVMRTATIPVEDVIAAGETADSSGYRTGSYTFTGVPDDGSIYRVYVAVTNFTDLYQNEEKSEYGPDQYYVVDQDADYTAVVNVSMTFAPADFDLSFTVDASAIAEGFRPTGADIVILYNDRLPGEEQVDPQTWPIITQQQQEDKITPVPITIGADGLAEGSALNITGAMSIWSTYPVWQTHPANYTYDYAIRLYQATLGGEVYDVRDDADLLPFTVSYFPARAWYDPATQAQTSPGGRAIPVDPKNPNGLVACLTPREYTITYELRRTGTVANATNLDGDTAAGKHTWSRATALPTAVTSDGATFIGWFTGDGTNGSWGAQVTSIPADTRENITLYARWSYTVTWKDWNGDVLEKDERVAEGTVPTYDRDKPAKAADAHYTYTFSGWTSAVSAVTGNVTYRAAYSTTVNSYTITWENDDGTGLKKDEDVPYGTMPAYTGKTPVKADTAQYSYTFSGWTPVVSAVTGNRTYRATYRETVKAYTVWWRNEDGTLLETDLNVAYGDTARFEGATPTKAGTGQYSYSFTGWSPEVVPVEGNQTYYAVFTDTVNSYRVIWQNEDGSELRRDTVAYGEIPSYGGEDPTKAPTAQYSYTFAGWDHTPAAVTGDQVYKATYTSTLHTYKITWKDESGAILLEEELPYNSLPVYHGGGLVKAATAQYTYTFTGWSPQVKPVTGDAVYTAVYSGTSKTYLITWVDEDGTTILDQQRLAYGAEPKYQGATPTKASAGGTSYVFSGWSPAMKVVTGSATYTATYSDGALTYTVTYTDGLGGAAFANQTTSDLAYNADTPAFVGIPARSGYLFVGWSPVLADKVVSDATYTARWKSDENGNGTPDEEESRFYVLYTDGVDGETIFADQKAENLLPGTATPAFVGTPTRSGYTFAGWSPAPSAAVTASTTYTAQWTPGSSSGPVEPQPYGSAELTKVDAADPTSLLDKATFQLYRLVGSEESFIGTYTTDPNGRIFMPALPAGEYFWRELRAPEGYKLDATKHHFTVLENQTARTTVTNTHSAVPDVFTDEHYAYIIGYSDGKVHPEANITRAEVATILFRLLSQEVRSEFLSRQSPFSDVAPRHWFNTAVSTMTAMGIISGYPDDTFKPNNPITRAEFAALCARFDEFTEGQDASFADVYGHWAEDEIAIAVANGWLLGYEDGTFHPNQHITRAEAILVINRVLQRIPGSVADLLPGMVEWPDNADPNRWYYLAIQEATNSHTYDRNTNGREYWVTLTTTPDWSKLGQ